MAIHVAVLTSDKYIEAVRPFLYLYDKYWKSVSVYKQPDVTIFGFAPPKWAAKFPSHVKFESLGKFSDYPLSKWSDAFLLAIYKMLEGGRTHSIIMLEDYWITHPVNVVAVDHAWKFMMSYDGVVKFDLCGDRLYSANADLNYGKFGVLNLVKSKPWSPYHLSLMAGIWNLDHLRKIIKPGWSPWDVEIDGTAVLSDMEDLDVIGSHQWPVLHTLAFRSGDIGKIFLEELKLKDQEELSSLGLLRPWQ